MHYLATCLRIATALLPYESSRYLRGPSFPPFRSRLKAPASSISSSASTGKPGGPARTATANTSPPKPQPLSSRLERADPDAPIQSALFSQLGHKGDLILIHFRDSLEALNQVELDLAQTELYDFLDPRHSYVSVVELGLYESSRKTYEAASAKGFEPSTRRSGMPKLSATLERGRAAMAPASSLPFPKQNTSASIPWTASAANRSNWYTVPFAERQRMMHEHGLIGRRYGDAGQADHLRLHRHG